MSGAPVLAEQTQQPKQTLHDLKIMIVSTPKTGNTWLRHLLAAIYDLPTVKLGFPFGPAAADALGQRWIMHQHYAPEPALLEWARQNGVVLVTTIRHPGDVLLSLYHYVHSYNDRLDFYQLAALAEDDGTFGAPVRAVLQTIFKDLIALSVDWVATGASHVVEYEALHYQPVETLTALTNAIHPVSRDCIERAIESCNIREMRATAQDNRAFFRQGSYGGWRQVLPPDLVDFLRITEPYPAQFAALGYTLDAQDKWSAATAARLPAKAGFFEQFGHRPATASLLKSIYLSFDTEDAQRRWPNLAQSSAPTAFHAWLNQPAEDDPGAPGARPLITNIAAQIHRLRTHLSTSFPDLYSQDRADFVLWLLEHAAPAYQLDDSYIAPLRDSFAEWAATAWATAPDTNDPAYRLAGEAAARADVPVLTYLARQIYRRRTNLRAIFPDLYGRDRIEFVRWFLDHAAREYGLSQACIEPMRQAFSAWATRPSASDPARPTAGSHGAPVLTNLAVYFYDRRPDLHTAYPDLYGQHRIDILRWMIAHAAEEFGLEPAWVEPLRRAFADWATQIDAHDPAARDDSDPGVPRSTNLAVYIYDRRPDLRAVYPDRYGRHRIDILRWMVAHAAEEFGLEPAWVEPLRRAFADWATQIDAHDPAARDDSDTGVPRSTNLAAYIYDQRPDLRAAYPDRYGRQRIDFLLWLLENAAREYQIDDSCIAPLRRQFLAWAHGSRQQTHDRLVRSGYDRYARRRAAYLSQYLIAQKQITDTRAGALIYSVSRFLLKL